MASLLGIKLHEGLFFDKSGRYLGSKLIKASTKWGLSKRTFEYKGGSYNVKWKVSRAEMCYFPWFFDRIQYYYQIGNPDPLDVKTVIKPLMNADDYNVQLESKILRELNKVRIGGLAALLTPRNIIIGLIIIAAIIYFASGGTLIGTEGGTPA
jgi:hypothetical protein